MTGMGSAEVFCDNLGGQASKAEPVDDAAQMASTLADVQLNGLDNVARRPRGRSLSATSRPLVYITRRVPQRGVDVLLPTCNISQWDSEEAVPRGELLQNVQGVHGILCMPSDVIDRQVLDAAGEWRQKNYDKETNNNNKETKRGEVCGGGKGEKRERS